MSLTSIPQYPSVGIAGQRYGIGPFVADSLKNDAANVAKIVDVTIDAVANDTAYTITVNGVPVTYTSDASATLAEIQAGLVAAIGASPWVNGKVSAAPSGNDVRLTELAPADGEVTITAGANLTAAVVTPHAEAEPMAAGIIVARTAIEHQCRLPRGASARPGGIVEHHQYAAGSGSELAGSAIYAPNSVVPVGRRGRWYVTAEQNVNPDAAVYFRHTAKGANVTLGALRIDGDGGTASQILAAEWKSTTTAGGLAVLELALP